MHALMRFLPSSSRTSGSSFGVVNVYTRPEFARISRRMLAPVRTESSYAFFMIPCRLLEKVTCLRVLFSMYLMGCFCLAVVVVVVVVFGLVLVFSLVLDVVGVGVGVGVGGSTLDLSSSSSSSSSCSSCTNSDGGRLTDPFELIATILPTVVGSSSTLILEPLPFHAMSGYASGKLGCRLNQKEIVVEILKSPCPG